jgi:hypothetical protein
MMGLNFLATKLMITRRNPDENSLMKGPFLIKYILMCFA